MNQESKPRGLRIPLWVPVTLAFILLIAAWTTLIVIAQKHPTERVPVETASATEQPE